MQETIYSTASVVKTVVFAVTACVGAFFLTIYLRIELEMLGRIAIVSLALAAYYYVVSRSAIRRKEIIALAILSGSFDFSLILGYHIVISSPYSGTAADNYISSYSTFDLLAYLFMFPVILVIAASLFTLLKKGLNRSSLEAGSRIFSSSNYISFSKKSWLLLTLAIFISWIPYLVVYYPGFVFGDTTNSFDQIIGYSVLRNHHPVMYTLFLGACWQVAHFFGLGNAEGCAIYCLVQMAIMAICFAYLIQWLISRMGLCGKPKWIVVVVLYSYFGLSPYIATYSIAMWKDPLFSVALMMITLFLADLILSDDGFPSFGWLKLLLFALFSFVLVFFRNNGVYVLALTVVALILLIARARLKTKMPKVRIDAAKMLTVSICVIAVYSVVTGPVYKEFGVAEGSSAEALGVPLNQMARVAATDGEMSLADKEYLNRLLPLELYPETYRPCCTDLLKWDDNFNDSALESGFFERWLSMLVHNPVTYFESWELQSFGFWTVNHPELYERENISGGGVKNDTDRMADYGMDPDSGITNASVRQLFPQNEASVPIGAIFWMLLFLIICIYFIGEKCWMVAIVPSMALLLTLLIASPIWYWPRYAAAVQFLLPFWCFLFYAIGVNSSISKKHSEG